MTEAVSFPSRSLKVGAAALIALAVSVAAIVFASQTDAAGTVLVRGIVKSGGDASNVNLYITHVASAPDATAIRGHVKEVNVSSATKYKWVNTKGTLAKTKVASNPVPEMEVVVRGTLQDDGDIKASWIVQNYREFTIEGTLQNVTLDTGKTDQGYVTVNISSSKLRGIVPALAFKETHLKGKDWKFRVNGQTALTALGTGKQLDEVTASQQKVRLEGQVLNEDSWAVSRLNEF